MLIGRGFKSFVGKGFVVKAYILEMVKTSIGALNMGLNLPGVLFGYHGEQIRRLPAADYLQ
jgi:hypothetical protein